MKYFTSDWHLSHTNIMQSSERPFDTIEEMDQTIIQNLLDIIEPGDAVYFLGDLFWKKKAAREFFALWPKHVQFHWILGNHDRGYNAFKEYCTSIQDMKSVTIAKHPVVLCHYPMITWDKSHYNAWLLYGHHHQNSNGTSELDQRVNGKMLNVNLEFHEYRPWSEPEIVAYMDHQPDNWDLIP